MRVVARGGQAGEQQARLDLRRWRPAACSRCRAETRPRSQTGAVPSGRARSSRPSRAAGRRSGASGGGGSTRRRRGSSGPAAARRANRAAAGSVCRCCRRRLCRPGSSAPRRPTPRTQNFVAPVLDRATEQLDRAQRGVRVVGVEIVADRHRRVAHRRDQRSAMRDRLVGRRPDAALERPGWSEMRRHRRRDYARATGKPSCSISASARLGGLVAGQPEADRTAAAVGRRVRAPGRRC